MPSVYANSARTVNLGPQKEGKIPNLRNSVPLAVICSLGAGDALQVCEIELAEMREFAGDPGSSPGRGDIALAGAVKHRLIRKSTPRQQVWE